MKNTFSVHYGGNEIRIVPLPADKHGNIFYDAYLPGEKITIVYKEDDEGAGHWLDEKTNNTTAISLEIGELIELYLLENKLDN
ncbi:MAG: hypothetical protein V4717_02935 [Bacteroidota bacterium]